MKRIKSFFIPQRIIPLLLDILLLVAISALVLWIRFDFSVDQIPNIYKENWLLMQPIQIIVTIAVFIPFGMYHFIWRTVGLYEVIRMVPPIIIAFILSYALSALFGCSFPMSSAFIMLILELVLLSGMRCSLHLYSEFCVWWNWQRHPSSERIMLIGAGAAGQMLLQEMRHSGRISGKVCCIVDDNPTKWNNHIGGIRVYGGRDQIASIAKQEHITQIILAMPSASPKQLQELLQICNATGCKVKKLPGIYQFVNGQAHLADVQDVQIEDLLGRDPVQLDAYAVKDFIQSKVVMVTGGGGSIGSELCRQIATHHPQKLIILDIYENNAYDIQQELRRTYGDSLNLQVEIASIRDKAKIEDLFALYRPDIVFHAAAHKHVPLMENCPTEAIKNNVFGTYHVVRAAEKYKVKKFVMISTDKAVNPTNIMGATKRFCEMILQSRYDSTTEFCAVRFGNVLGSNGSVVPLFKRQIANGGPVTITDKRIIRYFMTIPEAAQLVLEAGSMAQRNQIFVLDMGEPVKILDLAENLIRLSGLEPYRDIQIKEIGLRPGEKLYEELLMSSNDLSATANKKIFVEQQQQIDHEVIMDALVQLDEAITSKVPSADLIALMKEFVPTYHDPSEVNKTVDLHTDSSEKENIHQ